MKTCVKCGELKEFSEFAKRKGSSDGYRGECKLCRLEYQRKWVKEGPDKKTYADSSDKKQCRKCMEILPKDQFGKSKQSKDGLKSYCKACKRKESAGWREGNQDYAKKYREDNKEHISKLSKEWRENNKEIVAIKKKEYVAKNKEAEDKRKKDWYEKNKERILTKKKKYYEENKEEICKREWQYTKNSVQARLRHTLRNRFRNAMHNNSSGGAAIRLLGCSMEDFKSYLEKKFQPGMTWDNYGEWHIDHIMPLSSFNLSDRVQVKKACHYTNLQPLWAKDNLSKGAKLPQNKGDKK